MSCGLSDECGLLGRGGDYISRSESVVNRGGGRAVYLPYGRRTTAGADTSVLSSLLA